MRFSRFKQSILGHTPAPRNRNPTKTKVAKSKKEPKANKSKGEHVKAESSPSLEAQQPLPKPDSHHIKNETLFKTELQPSQRDSRYTATELPTVSMGDGHPYLSNRLLTPCSDTDIFIHAHHSLATSPVSEYHHEQPFHNYSAAPVQCAGNESNHWQESPSPFSPYLRPYDVEGYGSSPFSGPHELSQAVNFGVSPGDTMVPDLSHVPVKHEHWDTQHTVS